MTGWLDNNNMTLLVYFQIPVLLQKVPKGILNVDILDLHSHSIISQMRTFSLPPNIHAYLQLQLRPSFPLRPKKQLHHFVFRWSPLFHSGSFSSSLWGENKLAKMAWSGSLPPRSINNDYVTTEIIYSTTHACHEVYVTAEVTYSTAHVPHKVFCAVGIYEPHLRKLRNFTAASWLCPLGQPWEERINMWAVPMSLQVSYQPLRSHFAYPEFSEQYEEWSNWPQTESAKYSLFFFKYLLSILLYCLFF